MPADPPAPTATPPLSRAKIRFPRATYKSEYDIGSLLASSAEQFIQPIRHTPVGATGIRYITFKGNPNPIADTAVSTHRMLAVVAQNVQTPSNKLFFVTETGNIMTADLIYLEDYCSVVAWRRLRVATQEEVTPDIWALLSINFMLSTRVATFSSVHVSRLLQLNTNIDPDGERIEPRPTVIPMAEIPAAYVHRPQPGLATETYRNPTAFRTHTHEYATLARIDLTNADQKAKLKKMAAIFWNYQLASSLNAAGIRDNAFISRYHTTVDVNLEAVQRLVTANTAPNSLALRVAPLAEMRENFINNILNCQRPMYFISDIGGRHGEYMGFELGNGIMEATTRNIPFRVDVAFRTPVVGLSPQGNGFSLARIDWPDGPAPFGDGRFIHPHGRTDMSFCFGTATPPCYHLLQGNPDFYLDWVNYTIGLYNRESPTYPFEDFIAYAQGTLPNAPAIDLNGQRIPCHDAITRVVLAHPDTRIHLQHHNAAWDPDAQQIHLGPFRGVEPLPDGRVAAWIEFRNGGYRFESRILVPVERAMVNRDYIARAAAYGPDQIEAYTALDHPHTRVYNNMVPLQAYLTARAAALAPRPTPPAGAQTAWAVTFNPAAGTVALRPTTPTAAPAA